MKGEKGSKNSINKKSETKDVNITICDTNLHTFIAQSPRFTYISGETAQHFRDIFSSKSLIPFGIPTSITVSEAGLSCHWISKVSFSNQLQLESS